MKMLKAYQKKLAPIILLFFFFLFIGGMAIMRNLAGKIAEYNDCQTILDLRPGYSFQECYFYIFDLGENLFIRQMIKNFLSMPQHLCCISSIFTVLKFVCTYSSLGCCCLLIILFIKQHVIR